MKKYDYRILCSFVLMIFSVITSCIIAVHTKTSFYGSENISTLLKIMGLSLLLSSGWTIYYNIEKIKIFGATAIIWFSVFLVNAIYLIIVSLSK